MKPPRAVALARSIGPCQRPGCLNLGRMRLQKRKHTSRSLHLCGGCLESLLPIYLNDLFVKFGTTLKIDAGGEEAGRRNVVSITSKQAKWTEYRPNQRT
jgi:hypothetical protein